MVREFIDRTNIYMEIFLKLFSIEKVEGLSPLMVEMNSPKDILTLVVDFFKPTPIHPRDQPTKNRNKYKYDNGDDNVTAVNCEDYNSKNSKFMTPTSMINIVRTHIIDSQVTKGCGEENYYKNKEDDKK